MPAEPKSSAAKAREISEIATWLAAVCDQGEPGAKLVQAIDRAHEALKIISESTLRNQICAALASTRRAGDARGLIGAILQGPSKATGTTANLTQRTIEAALAAWRRGDGARANGEPDKWEATARVLNECGLGHVTPEALRKGWDRRAR